MVCSRRRGQTAPSGLSKKSRICPQAGKKKTKSRLFKYAEGGPKGRFRSILLREMRGFWFSCDFLDNPYPRQKNILGVKLLKIKRAA